MKRKITITGLLMVGVAALYAFSQLQPRLRSSAALLPLTFAHIDHMSVNCIACHHNYIDDSGQGLCLECHKTDPAVSAIIETQFHTLCRDCHLEQQQSGEDGGPTRDCLACHEGDDAP